MPLTEIQIEILKLLAQNRSIESYLAGGALINRAADSLRISDDLDLFHDSASAVQLAYQKDKDLLLKAGFLVNELSVYSSFIKSLVTKGEKTVEIDWTSDSAFRFFPIVEDPLIGFRLHDVDAALNKCSAAVHRIALRDQIDLIQCHNNILVTISNLVYDVNNMVLGSAHESFYITIIIWIMLDIDVC